MTLYTNRNNIKPMLRFISVVMVVFICLFTTGTLQRIRSWQSTIDNCLLYHTISFSSLWITYIIQFIATLFVYFSFFTFVIFRRYSIGNRFTMFSLPIFAHAFIIANFTNIVITIFSSVVFVKVRQRFDLLAFRAFSGYVWVRHGFLLIRKSCLEPVAGYTLRSAHSILLTNRFLSNINLEKI